MSYDLVKYAQWDDPQQDAQIADIVDNVNRRAGITTDSSGNRYIWIGEIDGPNYWLVDSDDKMSLYLNSTLIEIKNG